MRTFTVTVAILVTPLIVFQLTSCGGSGGGASSSGAAVDAQAADGGLASNVEMTAPAFGSSLLLSTTIPPGFASTITVSGSSMRANALMQGGGNVNEIVFDSSQRIQILEIANPGGFYYSTDLQTGAKNGDWLFDYFSLWFGGNNTLGAILPNNHIYQSLFPSGDYRFVVGNPTEVDALVNVYQVSKTDPDFTSGVLDLNLFVYTVGEPNAVISDRSEAETIKRFMNDRFNQVGIMIGTVNIEFIDDPDAIMQASVDIDSLMAFMRSASRATEGRSDTGINCFLLPVLPDGIGGLDGSIPGPGFLHGTSASGLVAQLATLGFAATGLTAHETDLNIMLMFLSHEIGHYLGLFHPTEGNPVLVEAMTDLFGSIKHDPLMDTPECGIENDTDGDGALVPSECLGRGGENMMFWGLGEFVGQGNFQTDITQQQGQVINTHPSVL